MSFPSSKVCLTANVSALGPRYLVPKLPLGAAAVQTSASPASPAQRVPPSPLVALPELVDAGDLLRRDGPGLLAAPLRDDEAILV